MGTHAARRKMSVTIETVSTDVFNDLIRAAAVREVPLVREEYFLGGESIGCIDQPILPYELSSIRALEAHIAQNRDLPPAI